MAADTSVFVSYRRDDSKHAAGRLGERLHERFRLFMDIDNSRPGTDFTAVVRETSRGFPAPKARRRAALSERMSEISQAVESETIRSGLGLCS